MNAFSPITFIIPACLVAAAAWAEVPPPPHAPGIESAGYVWNEPDKEKDRILRLEGDAELGKRAYRGCQGCHKPDASGRAEDEYPQLAGQHITVLVKQMVDVRAGRRDNPKMHPFIGDEVISGDDIGDIAAYLSGLPIPATNGKGDGKQLIRGGLLYEEDCAACHGDHGEGKAEEFYPMVAAQHYKYLLRESLAIRDGSRRNAYSKMVRVIRHYTDAEIDAVADYMSRLPPPRVTGRE